MSLVQERPDHRILCRNDLQVCGVGVFCLGQIYRFPDVINIWSRHHAIIISEAVSRVIRLHMRWLDEHKFSPRATTAI